MKKRRKIQDQHRAQLKLADDIQDGERALGSMHGEEKARQETELMVMRQQVKPDKVALSCHKKEEEKRVGGSRRSDGWRHHQD